MEVQGEPMQNTIVIGERVGGLPVVLSSLVPQDEPEQPVKVEPIAQGVPHEGTVQPVIVPAHTEEAPALSVQKRVMEQTLQVRKTRARRIVTSRFEVGSRVGTKGTQDGVPKWFFGTIKQQASVG